MKILPLALLLIAVAPALAQSDWTTADTADLHTLDQVRYMQLTPAEKSSLQALTAPALQRCAAGDPSFDAADAFNHARARRADLGNGVSGFVVEGSGCLCSALGNCSYWIVTTDMRTLFEGTAQNYALLTSQSGDHYDLVTVTHLSATESLRTLYTFNGTQYHRAQCASVTLANVYGEMRMKPTIKIQDCRQ